MRIRLAKQPNALARGRAGFSLLELQVAFVVFGIAIAGLCPLVVMQSKQMTKVDGWISAQNTYYLVPSSDPWTRKLGAVATVQTQNPGPRPAPPLLTIANGQTGYSETGSAWTTETNPNSVLGSDRLHAAGSGSNTASWQFTNLNAGWYCVQVTWSQGADRASNASYTVWDGTKQLGTYAVNQQNAPSGTAYQGRPWTALGVLPVSSGTAQVVLSDQANGNVVADSAWLVPVVNDVEIRSVERTLTGQSITVHVTVNVQVPQ